jgi:hypothetical protein
MTHTQQVQSQENQAGPVDDLKVVDRLSQGAAEQHKPTELPSTNTSNAAHADLTDYLIGAVDETVCRSVPAKDLRHYLFLAEELNHTRERALEKFHSEQLSKELELDELLTSTMSTSTANESEPSSLGDSTLVHPRVILRLLALFEISVDDWQEVTASASLPALLRAERSLRAMSLGLPKDATEAQIAVKPPSSGPPQLCLGPLGGHNMWMGAELIGNSGGTKLQDLIQRCAGRTQSPGLTH